VLAAAVSLTPGTAVLEIDLERRVWFVYALGPRDAAGVERARRRIADVQRRVLAAFGPRGDNEDETEEVRG
jgi:multicomponent Na+:H+ antiporter subunit E